MASAVAAATSTTTTITTTITVASAVPTSWDPDVTAPFELSTDDDQRGFLAIVTATAFCFALIGFIIRVYVRCTVGGFKADDWILTAGSIFAIIQTAVLFSAIQKGFGAVADLVSPDEWVPMLKAFFASDLLSLTTLFLSKLSTAFIYLRLTPEHKHHFATFTTIALGFLWYLSSLILLSARCHFSTPYLDISTQFCPTIYIRWTTSTVLSLATETVLFALSILLVYPLQMPLRSKTIVVSAFAARLFVILPSSLRLVFLKTGFDSPDPTFALVAAVAALQVEIGYSLLASTFPCLKPLMATYEGPLRPAARERYYQDGYYGGNDGGGGGNYKLSNYSGNGEGTKMASRRLRASRPGSAGPAGIDAVAEQMRIYGVHKGQGLESVVGGAGDEMGSTEGKNLNGDDFQQAIVRHGRMGSSEGEIGAAVDRGEGAVPGAEMGMGVIRKDVEFTVEREANPRYFLSRSRSKKQRTK